MQNFQSSLADAATVTFGATEIFLGYRLYQNLTMNQPRLRAGAREAGKSSLLPKVIQF
jgi:hypothetical protein